MKLKRFKVDKYKCIDHSGWIDVNDLTVIVGKNEAGKTTLLKALHKLNPFKPDPYNMEREWPRGKRKERNSHQVVCTAEFQLSANELVFLRGRLPEVEFVSDFITVARDYENDLVVDVAPLFKEDVEETATKEAFNYLKDLVPTFIYMDDYRVFNGSARLDQVQQRRNAANMTDEDKTLLTILELSGLDLDEEVKKGNLPDREQRQYDLDDASATLTNTIAERWNQKKYEVEFRADGQLFYTFVKDENDPALIRLEERSKGFQWFFSFDLMFMYESEGSFENCVILLDEPGLHLHPDGQRDLLRRLEHYAQDNTLIYSTHLPFMIDLQKPEGIRVITENNQGAFVTEELVNSQPESKFVLQAALGMSGATSYLLSQKNLVVEGVDDFWFLTEISGLLLRSGEEGFKEDILITPAGGASEAVYISTFMIGQKLQVYTLLDHDVAGADAKEKLIKKWLTKYHDQASTVETLSEVLGESEKEFSIEDIFHEDYYLNFVQEAYKSQLAGAGIKKLKITGEGMLVKRVERAFEDAGLKFNKGPVAKLIRKDLSRKNSITELHPDTKIVASKIISRINSKLT